MAKNVDEKYDLISKKIEKTENKLNDLNKKPLSIETSNWINVYLKVGIHIQPDWDKKRIESELIILEQKLLSIITNLQRVTFKSETLGHINPFIGKTTLFMSKVLKKGVTYDVSSFVRDPTFQRIQSKGEPPYVIIRFKETKAEYHSTKRIQMVDANIDNNPHGYSPVDFARDNQMFGELSTEIANYLAIPHKQETVGYFFNKEGAPCIMAQSDSLTIEHSIKDRLELRLKNPKLERACFGDKKLEYAIDAIRKTTASENGAKWIKAVDELLKKYKEQKKRKRLSHIPFLRIYLR